jgi:hypothetical protein
VLSRRTLLGVVAAALATHAGICGLFIQRAITTGAPFDYLGSPMDPCKTLLTEERLARILVREHGATIETLRERFLTDGNFVDVRSEQFIDLGLLERGGDGPDGAKPDHWFYLFDHTLNAEPPPMILQSGEIIARHEVAQFTLLVIKRDDPDAIIWPQVVVTPQGFL